MFATLGKRTVCVRGRECLAITRALFGEAGLPCGISYVTSSTVQATFSRRITCGPDTAEFCTALGSTAGSDHPINLWNRIFNSTKVDNHLNQGAVFCVSWIS